MENKNKSIFFNVICTKEQRKKIRLLIQSKKEEEENTIDFLLKVVGEYKNEL